MRTPLLVAAATATIVLGCRAGGGGGGEGVSDAQGAGSASATAAAESATVRASDCAAWAGHAADVIVGEFAAVAKACPAAGATETFAGVLGGREELRKAASEQCQKRVGAKLEAGEARCYLGAKTVAALFACKLGPMVSDGEKDVLAALAAGRARCGLAPPEP
jgi:hypothetical protein